MYYFQEGDTIAGGKGGIGCVGLGFGGDVGSRGQSRRPV